MEDVNNLSIYRYALEEYPSQLIRHNYWQRPVVKKMIWKLGKANNNKVILKIKAKNVQGYQWEYSQENDKEENDKEWKICSRDSFRKSKGWNKKKYTFVVDNDDKIEKLNFRCRLIVFEGASFLQNNAILSKKNWKWINKPPIFKKIKIKKKHSYYGFLLKASAKRVMSYQWKKRLLNEDVNDVILISNPYDLDNSDRAKFKQLRFQCTITGYNREKKTRQINLNSCKEYPIKENKHDIKQSAEHFLDSTELKFLRWRKHDVSITTPFYCVLLISCLVQAIIFLLRKDYAISLAKLIGAALAGGSFHAWWEQLKKEEEFYGWALGNYSKDVPIYETMIRFKRFFRSIRRYILSFGKYILYIFSFGIIKRQATSSKNVQSNPSITPSMIIISDWLKNRPSVTYWLILMLSLTWIYKLFPELNISFSTELLLNIIFFILSFPLTSFKYAHKVKLHEKLGAIGFATAIFSIMFFLPLFIIRLLVPKSVIWESPSVIGKDFHYNCGVLVDHIHNFCKPISRYFGNAWNSITSFINSIPNFFTNTVPDFFTNTFPKWRDRLLEPSTTVISFVVIASIALFIVFVLYRIAIRTANKTKESDDRLIKAIEAQLKEKSKEDNEKIKEQGEQNIVDCFGRLTGYGQKRFLRRILADLTLSQALRKLDIDSQKLIGVSNNNESTELIQELYSITLESKQGEE